MSVAQHEGSCTTGRSIRRRSPALHRRSAFTLERSVSATTLEVLGKKKLPPPTCWADIIKPEYKG